MPVQTILIPHRVRRSFAHAADIYRSVLQALALDGSAVSHIGFELRQILGSDVELQLGAGQPGARVNDSVVTFVRDGRECFAILKNAGAKVSLRNSYDFDESAVRPSLEERNGEYSFRQRFHESNIHMLLSPIKFILPFWPERPDDARVLRLSFNQDVQKLDINTFSLRTQPRQSFSITRFFYSGEPIGEVTHYFLNGGRP